MFKERLDKLNWPDVVRKILSANPRKAVVVAALLIAGPVLAQGFFDSLKESAKETMEQVLPQDEGEDGGEDNGEAYQARKGSAVSKEQQTSVGKVERAGLQPGSSLSQYFQTSPVFKFDNATSMETIKKEYPDLRYFSDSDTQVTIRAKSKLIEKIAFSLYQNKLRDTRIYLREGVGSSGEISAAAKSLGYTFISERDIKLVGNHNNGSTFEASTSRREHRWNVVVGALDHQREPAAIAVVAPAASGSLGVLDANASADVLQNHLTDFIRSAPLFQFTSQTPLRQIRRHYPGLGLLSGKVSDYGAQDGSSDFIDRVEFHTENDGKRLTWIGVFFKPGLNQKAMAQAFSVVLKAHYGELLRDTSSEHLVRRKDFTNAFHTRWYFRQKQWGAGIYPPS